MAPGMTLDTGALIALERRYQRMTAFLKVGQQRRSRVIAPAAVIAEWWRARTNMRELILA